MLAFLFGILTFHVVPIPLPASYGVSTFDPIQDALPPPAALGASGSVALVVQPAGGAQRIGIVRADGSTTYLPLPSPAELAKQIVVESPPTFSRIVLATDGTPFVTVSSCFEAVGGGGCRAADFVWTGAWHPLPHPSSGDGFSIQDAETLGTYVLEDDFDDRSMVDIHNLPPPSAYVYRAGSPKTLGAFAASAMRGRYVVGTESGETNVMDPPTPPPIVPHALRFDGNAIAKLGLGVANAVDTNGDVVGDDESTPGGPGHPTLWTKGTAVTLSTATGSAAAINDAGLIAGTAAGHLFLTDMHDPKHRIYALDDLLVDHGWHVERQFGIAITGRMLVIAHRDHGKRQLVLLEPARATP